MVGAAHRRRDAGALGLPVELGEHRADPLDALDEPGRRHRRGAVHDRLQRRQVGALEVGVVEDGVDHRRHEQPERDALVGGLGEPLRRVERPHQDHRAAGQQRRREQHPGGVRDRRARQVAAVGGEVPADRHRLHHLGDRPLGQHRRLRDAGRATGVEQPATGPRVGACPSAASSPAPARGRRVEVLAGLGRAEREHGRARVGSPPAARRRGRRRPDRRGGSAARPRRTSSGGRRASRAGATP